MGNLYSQCAIPDPDWDVAVAGLFGELDVRALATRGIAWEAPESDPTPEHKRQVRHWRAKTRRNAAAVECARVREATRQNALAERVRIEYDQSRTKGRVVSVEPREVLFVCDNGERILLVVYGEINEKNIRSALIESGHRAENRSIQFVECNAG